MAEILIEKYGYKHISTGEILRGMAQKEDDFGKDLSARLLYGVIVHLEYDENTSVTRELGIGSLHDIMVGNAEGKLYLRPMSSMTEEEFENLKEYSELKYEQLDLASYQNGTYKCLDFYLSEVPSYVVIKVFDWFNKFHFDYRGLIERGLAIDVTEENNPYKQ